MTEVAATDPIISALDLPPGARLDMRVPKKALLEQGAPTTTDKRAIQDGIEEMQWIAALKPNTVAIPAFVDEGRNYSEIAVLSATLRPEARSARLTELIHRAIPYPVLLITLSGARAAVSVAPKRAAQTHVDKHHMVFRLDAVDAYERKLVKQIEVASLEVEGGHNKAYVRFVSASNAKGTITARVEIDVLDGKQVRRREVTVQDGDNLEELTKRAIYADCRIGEIRAGRDNQLLEVKLPGDEKFLLPSQFVGGVDDEALKRLMIRRTIHEHLEKEKRLAPLGIKVLSLFFIDAVEHYRSYDADGHPVKGKYARIFEEEYRRAAKLPDFVSLFKEVDVTSEAEEVHDGYFSIDKARRWTDTADNNQAGRDNAERAYNLIMKDKEKLLSFDTKLKFIFSHSALKEGWDNPNVFQICALREIGTERERRQTIGRGLRLCVNQNGERLRGFDINTLTVIATESYEDFAENLQKEIEKDTGIKFGIVEKHQFATVPVVNPDGSTGMLGFEESAAIFDHLKAEGFVDTKGKVQDTLRTALKDGTLALPVSLAAHLGAVRDVLKKVAGKLDIKNADERVTVKTRQAILESAEFQALWDRIKHKTTYRVHFDNEKLITDCAKAIANGPPVSKARVRVRKADLSIGQGGVEAKEHDKDSGTIIAIEEGDISRENRDRVSAGTGLPPRSRTASPLSERSGRDGVIGSAGREAVPARSASAESESPCVRREIGRADEPGPKRRRFFSVHAPSATIAST